MRYGVYAGVTRDRGAWIIARLKRVVFIRMGLQGTHEGVFHIVPSRASDVPGPLPRVIADTAGILFEDAEDSVHLAHLVIDRLVLCEIATQLLAVSPRPGGSRLYPRTLSTVRSVGELERLVVDSYTDESYLPASSKADSVAALFGDDFTVLQDSRTTQSVYNFGIAFEKPLIDPAAVRAVLSPVMDIPALDIAEGAELQALGLDSLTYIEARYEFQTRLGVKVHGQTLFDCRTVRDIFQVVSSPARSSLFHPTFISPAFLSPTEHRKPSENEHDDQHKRPLIFPVELAAGDPILKDSILGVDRILLLRIQRAPPNRLAQLGCDVCPPKNMDYTCSFASPRDTNAVPCEGVGILPAVFLGLPTPCFFFAGGDMGYEYGKGCYVDVWSFGGVFASAIAQTLLRMGFRVRGLVLLDVPAPQTQSALPPWLLSAVAAHAAGPRDAFMRWPAYIRDAACERAQQCNEEQMRPATRALVGYDHATQGRGPCPPVVSLRGSIFLPTLSPRILLPIMLKAWLLILSYRTCMRRLRMCISLIASSWIIKMPYER
ncbi:hypothetical protein BD413DRAFT_641735 [Trametes elegans]|nr:hypothetical protein BD413DRAFT_641735 [Trametes elegans]